MMKQEPEDRWRVQRWDADDVFSEKRTTTWCDARDEHFHDDNTNGRRASSSSASHWIEVDEHKQRMSVNRPFDLLHQEDMVKLERELKHAS